MLTLLLCSDWVAGRNAVFDQIKKNVAKEIEGNILIVPELISHDAERRLCQTSGNSACRFAEVLSFSRLVRRVCDYAHLRAPECLDNGGRVVAMAAAARQLHSKLKAYAAVETKPEFLSGLIDAVDEFKRCCIGAEDLRIAALKTEGSLAQKLEELSLMLEAYDALCAQGKRDPRDQMNWLLEQLEDCDFASNHRFFVDGFPDLTRQHLAIVEHAIQYSPEVVISLNCDQIDSAEPAFEKSAATALEIIRCAQRHDVAFEVKLLAPQNSVFKDIWTKLFRGRLETGLLHDRLFTYRADSVYEECVLVAQKIQEQVQEGARYKDFSVVCTDVSLYKNIVSSVFTRCGIPCYLSGTESVLDKPVIATVLSALEAAWGGFEQRDMIRYIRSMFSGIRLNQCDKLENYTFIWNISGKKWLASWKNHPEGLSDRWTERNQQDLIELENLREKIIQPLVHLRDSFLSAANLSGQVTAVYTFLEELSVAQQLSKIASRLSAANEDRQAQIFSQLWEILIGALEQMYDLLGNTVWEPEAFIRLFKLLLSQYDVGTIPPVLDAVTFGPVSAMRCQESKVLFVIGAAEGALPGYSGAAGILNDQERTQLRALGVPLTGGAMEGLQAEFSEIYGVFCGAREQVYVTCPAGQPSFVYRRLTQLAGEETDCSGIVGPALFDKAEAGAFLARFGDADAAKQLNIQPYYDDAILRRSYQMGKVERENIDALYGQTLRLSASQIDKQADCRLHYFLRYGLRVRERKQADVDPAEFGTYVHAVLELSVKEIMQRGGFKKVTMEEALEIANSYSVAYEQSHFGQLDSERMTYLFKRNSSELKLIVQELWQEFQKSDFVPVGFEVAFGDDKQMPAVAVPGKTKDAVLGGFVDRVDQWNEDGRNYFRVVDYKTGKKDFDYCDVFNGLGLQMLLYLFALEDGGQELLGVVPKCAGVQYFSARAPLISADGSMTVEEAAQAREAAWKRKGLILSDSDVLQAMDQSGNMQRLSCKVNKDGIVSGDIADSEQFKLLKKYVFMVVGRLVDEIASGNIDANPYTRGSSHNACRYCPYSSICNAETVEGRRNYKAMTAKRFWEEVEKGVKEDG